MACSPGNLYCPWNETCNYKKDIVLKLSLIFFQDISSALQVALAAVYTPRARARLLSAIWPSHRVYPGVSPRLCQVHEQRNHLGLLVHGTCEPFRVS